MGDWGTGCVCGGGGGAYAARKLRGNFQVTTLKLVWLHFETSASRAKIGKPDLTDSELRRSGFLNCMGEFEKQFDLSLAANVICKIQ